MLNVQRQEVARPQTKRQLARSIYQSEDFKRERQARYDAAMAANPSQRYDRDFRSSERNRISLELFKEMAALDGRPVQTKEQQAAENAARKSARKASVNSATKSRFAKDDGATKEATFEQIRSIAKRDGLDMDLVEEFISGKTEFNVKVFDDGRVMRWFMEAADKMKVSKQPESIETGYVELCGNADVTKWIEGVPKDYINEAKLSAMRAADFYLANRSRTEAFEGQKAIARRLGTCLYLHHITRMSGDTVTVLHPLYETHPEEMATQRHADVVAKVLSASTGRQIKALPSPVGFMKISDRKCE